MLPDPNIDRRALLGGLAAALIAGPVVAQGLRPATLRPTTLRTVALLGDSITAGYGLPADSALPRQLELELARIGAPARVRSLGVTGDTTAKGLARLDSLVTPAPDLWVVALGGNDLLLGLDPTETRANLDRIVDKLQARGAPVVLAGILAPTFFGRAYAQAFDSAFAEVARTHGLPFYPNLLAEVIGRRGLNQPDGIHPNAEGVKVVARGLAPVIARTLGPLR